MAMARQTSKSGRGPRRKMIPAHPRTVGTPMWQPRRLQYHLMGVARACRIADVHGFSPEDQQLAKQMIQLLEDTFLAQQPVQHRNGVLRRER